MRVCVAVVEYACVLCVGVGWHVCMCVRVCGSHRCECVRSKGHRLLIREHPARCCEQTKSYALRPEVAESLFILHQVTGNPVYRGVYSTARDPLYPCSSQES